MVQPPRSVLIESATPAGAACATVLNRAGVSVRMTPPSGTVPSSLAVISRALLGDLGLGETSWSQPVETIIERRLTEDDALDTVKTLADEAIVQRPEIVEALLRELDVSASDGSNKPMLTVEAGEFRLGDPEIQDSQWLPVAKVSECISLDWDLGNTARATWIKLNGEGLSDVNGQASILTTPDRTALILVAPMAAIVDASISVVDVLARLMTHPAVRSALPEGEPVLAGMRLLRSGDPLHLTLRGGVTVRVGAAAGLADPVKLDRELRSGMVAAEQIAEAIAADRANVAQLSRITRAWAADAAQSIHA